MLTHEQIEQLFSFCKKHFVRYYDVQVELVDHLANAIEEKMAADKKLSFETALDRVFAGFGIKGFGEVVNSRTQSLFKHYRKVKRQIFISYFTWPKAAMTLCLFLILSLLKKLLTVDQQAYFIAVLFLGLWLFELSVVRQVRHLRKKQSLPLLITGAGEEESFFGVYMVAQVMLFLSIHPVKFVENILNFGSFSLDYFLIIIVMILLFVGILAYKDVANKIQQMARDQYPEAFIAAK